MISHRRIALAWISGLGLLAACTDKPSDPGACFPVPTGGQAMTVEPGMEAQGTSLQGGDPAIASQHGARPPGNAAGYIGQQGIRLQGDDLGYMSQQGTLLQDDAPGFINNQGRTLQGRSASPPQMQSDTAGYVGEQGISLQGKSPAFMSNQGSELQGEDPGFVSNQGTELQGEDPGFVSMQGIALQGHVPAWVNNQGTTLQGQRSPDLGRQLQGITLQGHAAAEMPNQGRSLHGEAPDLSQMQGTSLQGEASNFMQQQGTRLQGGAQGAHLQAAQPRAYRGLADLDGARMVLQADASKAVTLQDGQLTAPGFADTASLRGTAITATASDGRQFRIDIVSITEDDATERIEIDVDGQPACQSDQQGVFVGGRWDGQAAHIDDAGLVTYSCMDGVIAKCVHWGYAPWLTDASVHASCTRMARADYCGNGTPWTLDGTMINIVDRLGIHPALADGGMKFEAAWSPSGAVCVAKSRYEIEDGAGRTVLPACFASLPRCASLDDAAAQGAVLANQSQVMPIDACE